MAKRGSSSARKSGATRRGKPAKDAGFEVQEAGDEAAPAGPSLEAGLVFVTFVALMVGLIVSQIELSSAYGRGLF